MTGRKLAFSIFLSSCLVFELLEGGFYHRDFGDRVACGDAPHPMRVAARHIEGKGVGYNEGYTTLETFIAPWVFSEGICLPFVDLRAHIFNDNHFAGNAGLGLRFLSSSRVWGGNLYFDYRKTSHRSYTQASFGLESLGEVWDLRINGYFPLGKQKSSLYGTPQFVKFKGHYAYISNPYEFAMKGANAEVGAHLNKFEKFPLYFAAGPYYLEGKGKMAWGGKVRAAIDFYDHFRLEASSSYDNLFKWIGQGEVSLTFSFGGKKKVKKTQDCSRALALATRAYQKVDRSEIIPVGETHKTTQAINPVTGDPYFFWFVDNLSHSLGTFESPFPTLAEAQNVSLANDIIYVFPGDGIGTGLDTGLILKTNQKFWGSSTDQTLRTTLGEAIIPAVTSNLPLIQSSSDVITLADGNEISGLYILANNGNGFTGTSITDLTISNNYIQTTSASPNFAVNLNNMMGQMTIDGNFISASNLGIGINNTNVANSHYIIKNNTSSSVDAGIQLNYSETQKIKTEILSNHINTSTLMDPPTDAYAVLLNMSNQDASSHSLLIKNNMINNQNTDIGLYLTGQANLNLTLENNDLFAESEDCIDLHLMNNAFLYARLSNNHLQAGSIGLQIESYDSSQATITLKNDFILSGTASIGGEFYNTTKGYLNLESNTLSSFDSGNIFDFDINDFAQVTQNVKNLTTYSSKSAFWITQTTNASYQLNVSDSILNSAAILHTKTSDNSVLNYTFDGVQMSGMEGDGLFHELRQNAHVTSTIQNSVLYASSSSFNIHQFDSSICDLNISNSLLNSDLPLTCTLNTGSVLNYHLNQNQFFSNLHEAIKFTLNDTSQIAGNITGNSFYAQNSGFFIFQYNASISQIVLEKNVFNIGIGGFPYEAAIFSQNHDTSVIDLQVLNNQLYVETGGGIYSEVADQSQGTFKVQSNDFKTWSNGVVVYSTGTSLAEINFSYNTLLTDFQSLSTYADTQGSIVGTISNNWIQTVNTTYPIWVQTFNAGNIELTVDNNTIFSVDGIRILGIDTSTISMDLNNNQISATRDPGIQIDCYANATGNFSISGTSILAPGNDGSFSEAVATRIQSHNNSILNVSFDYNSVTPSIDIFDFEKKDSSTFNLQSAVGNKGVIVNNTTAELAK